VALLEKRPTVELPVFVWLCYPEIFVGYFHSGRYLPNSITLNSKRFTTGVFFVYAIPASIILVLVTLPAASFIQR